MASIRKEQGLLLLAAAFGAYMYSGLPKEPRLKRPRPAKKEYVLPAGNTPISVTTSGPKNLREIFAEPSESRPLSPRLDLPFMKLEDLPVVLLPLPIGQQPVAYHELRHPAIVPPAAAADGKQGGGPAGGPAAAGPNGGAAPAPQGTVVAQDDPGKRYDLIRHLVFRGKFYGHFLGTDEDKYRLASTPGPYDGKVRFQWIDEKTHVTKRILEEDGKGIEVLKLADTLRNEIGMKLFKSRVLESDQKGHRDLIYYLLDKARREAWVFDKALDRADVYLKFATPREEGLLYKAKVLRAMGDLPATYKLFRDLDDDPKLKGSSFQLRGLGMVEAKLGLDKLAEEHLTQAVAINKPVDPRNYMALATFFLDRGRSREAVEPAKQAWVFKKRRDTTPAEQIECHEVYVRALLAVGDVAAAELHIARADSDDLQIEVNYQTACVRYAQRDFAGAETLFQAIYNTGRKPDALLGLAASQIAKGDLQTAKAHLRKVVDENPKLRHLALAGLGLAMSGGEGADALEAVDAGLLVYPNHPYLLYLQGRQRRLNGDLEGAIEPLKKALRQSDEFLEALAELTAIYYGIFQRDQDARSLDTARRYIDRLVELDQRQGAKDTLFFEMQGKIHFETQDWQGARLAFAPGDDGKKKSDFCQMGLAMLEYTQKRSNQAEHILSEVIRDLPSSDPAWKHAQHLSTLMVRHGNKEQVIDRLDRSQLGDVWDTTAGTAGLAPLLIDGSLAIKGPPGRPGSVIVRRTMTGPGRFLELRADIRIAEENRSTFAGLAVETGLGGRFKLAVGTDDRGDLVVELRDGKKETDRIKTGIRPSTDAWHTIVISVDDADDVDPKDTKRYLKVYFDGQSLIPQEKSQLKGLNRNSRTAGEIYTDLRVDRTRGAPIDVAFRNYRRVQEKSTK